MSHDPIVVTVVKPQPISVVTQILRGPAGADGGTFVKDYAIAGINLSGHRVVCKNSSNELIYADVDTANYGVLGMTTGAVSQGIQGEYIVMGLLQEPSWNWIPGELLFLQNNGAISQTPPPSGFILEIGRAISATKLFIQIQSAILRTNA